MQKAIDIALIDKCLSNNREAQKQLYKSLLPYLTTVVKRYLFHQADLEDVLQEAFIRIFKYMPSFDARKAAFKTWASRITINACRQRNDKNRKAATEELITEIHEPIMAVDFSSSSSEEKIIRWLKKMPADFFEVFNLFVIDGFSHAEISKVLQISESLSRKRLSRGRAWVKENIIEEDSLNSSKFVSK